jgi:flagellar motor switch protein FliG
MSNALAKFGSDDLAFPNQSGLSDQATDVLERAIADTHNSPPAAHFGTPAKLRRDQKAAIIVRLMHMDMGQLSLADLETRSMVQLVRATADLSFVDEATTLAVIDEFLTEIGSNALYFRPGLDSATAALQDHLSEDAAAMLASNKPANAPEDPWLGIQRMDPGELADILLHETPQVCAVVISKINAVKSAEILTHLSDELARDTTFAASKIGRIGEIAVPQIGAAIAQSVKLRNDQGALSGDPAERVGAILNFTPGTERELLISNLENHDSNLAERIRKIMFTFADIPDRVDVKDVAKLARAVENKILITALAAGEKTEPDTVQFILKNLSKRLSEQLVEEMREIGEVKPKDADAAMNAIIQGIRDLESQGVITLITQED